jgi:hypothetical protein
MIARSGMIAPPKIATGVSRTGIKAVLNYQGPSMRNRCATFADAVRNLGSERRKDKARSGGWPHGPAR